MATPVHQAPLVASRCRQHQGTTYHQERTEQSPLYLQFRAPIRVDKGWLPLLTEFCSTHHQVAMHSWSIGSKEEAHGLTEVLQKPPLSRRVEVDELMLCQVEGIHSSLPLQESQSCIHGMRLQVPHVSAHDPALHCPREAAQQGCQGAQHARLPRDKAQEALPCV